MLRQRILRKRLDQQHNDPSLLHEQKSVTDNIANLREHVLLTQQVSYGCKIDVKRSREKVSCQIAGKDVPQRLRDISVTQAEHFSNIKAAKQASKRAAVNKKLQDA